MGRYSFRDGKITASKLSYDPKILKTDVFLTAEGSSATALKGNTSFATTAAITPTVKALSHSRVVKFTNVMGAAAERKCIVNIVGYNQYGEYTSETLKLSSAAAGVTETVNAYKYLVSVTPNKYGTYATVTIGYNNKLALNGRVDSSGDILSVKYNTRLISTATWTVSTVANSTTFNATSNTLDFATHLIGGSSVYVSYLTSNR